MSWPDWLEMLATSAAQGLGEGWLGQEVLLYQERFSGPTLHPAPDRFSRGPLQLGDSGNISSALTIVPAAGAALAPSAGLRLEIDGTQTVTPVSVSLSISPFPTDLQVIRVVAAFRTVPSIPPAAGPWAAAVVVREGGAQDTADQYHRLGATMRVKDGVARLGTPQSTLQPSPPPAPDRYATLFPAGSSVPVEFVLQLLLDLAGDTYSATLITPGNIDTLPLDHAALPTLWKDNTSIGLALARTASSGHAAIDVQSFAVYGIVEPGYFGRRAAQLLGFVRRALLPRFVPPPPLR